MLTPTLARCVLAVVLGIVALIPCALADEFTSPSNSAADLSIKYTLGETVTITWTTSLQTLSLYVAHWGGDDIGALLSEPSLNTLITMYHQE
jgi:hypothetical protein